MKQNLLLFMAVLCGSLSFAFAQPTTWAKKKSLGFDVPARMQTSLSTYHGKIYILGGKDGGNNNDFIEYDPVTKRYTNLPSFPSTNPVLGFSAIVQNKLYTTSGYLFNFQTNAWEEMAFYPSDNYNGGFVIDDTIFVYSGRVYYDNLNAFYSYNITTNTWTQRAPYPGKTRRGAHCFAVNGKGYLGGGDPNGTVADEDWEGNEFLTDFYEYSPATDTWTPKASLPSKKAYGVATAANGKGYVGLGERTVGTSLVSVNDWYEYSPGTNTWQVKVNAPHALSESASASIGNECFVYAGSRTSNSQIGTSVMTRYNAGSDTWSTDSTGYLYGGNRTHAAAFFYNGKIYAGGGQDMSTSRMDWWEYDIATDNWTSKGNIPGYVHHSRAAASIGSKLYLIGGYQYETQKVDNRTDTVVEYNAVTNTWAFKKDFPGGRRFHMAAFAVDGKIYAGWGNGNTGNTDSSLRRFDPATNTWSGKLARGPQSGDCIGAFAIGTKGYILQTANYQINLYEYNTATNTWASKAALSSGGMLQAGYSTNQAFSYNGKGYVLLNSYLSASILYEYDPATDTWKGVGTSPFSGLENCYAVGTDAAYLLFGQINKQNSSSLDYNTSNQIWKLSFTPSVATSVGDINPPCQSSNFVSSQTVYDSAGGLVAALQRAESTSNACIQARLLAPGGTYRETFGYFGKTNNNGTPIKENGMFFNKNISLSASSNEGDTIRIYATNAELDSFVAAFNQKWATAYTVDDIHVFYVTTYPNADLDPMNNSDISNRLSIKPSVHAYDGSSKYFEIGRSGGYHGEMYLVLTAPCAAAKPTITASAPTTNVCPGTQVTLTSSPASTYTWSTGETTESIVVTTAGGYSVAITDANGCQSSSSDTAIVTYRTCPKPTKLVASNTTASGTTLSWKAASCGVSYQYEWRKKGTTKWSKGQTTGTVQTLTGLAAATTYQWRVVTRCQTTPTTISSGYSNGPEFTTAASFTARSSGAATTGQLSAMLSPNPVFNSTTLSISGAKGQVVVTVAGISGNLLWQSGKTTTATIVIPAEKWAAGTYLVTVKDSETTRVLKLVKTN